MPGNWHAEKQTPHQGGTNAMRKKKICDQLAVFFTAHVMM